MGFMNKLKVKRRDGIRCKHSHSQTGGVKLNEISVKFQNATEYLSL